MSIQNPTEKSCWVSCTACFRCADKGRYAKCEGCSGRSDPKRRLYSDPDDFCDCKNGILRYKTKLGRLIVHKYGFNPFKRGRIRKDEIGPDEKDWKSYLTDMREKLHDETWDPIRFTDGSSTEKWLNDYRRGTF